MKKFKFKSLFFFFLEKLYIFFNLIISLAYLSRKKERTFTCAVLEVQWLQENSVLSFQCAFQNELHKGIIIFVFAVFIYTQLGKKSHKINDDATFCGTLMVLNMDRNYRISITILYLRKYSSFFLLFVESLQTGKFPKQLFCRIFLTTTNKQKIYLKNSLGKCFSSFSFSFFVFWH